jgi:hypothetical protein
MSRYRAVIKDRNAFERKVFGADCFLQWWPEILTTGVTIERQEVNGKGWYYILGADGRRVNHTAFFTWKEMQGTLKLTKLESS